jgi:hypothetical protein
MANRALRSRSQPHPDELRPGSRVPAARYAIEHHGRGHAERALVEELGLPDYLAERYGPRQR